MPFNFPDVPIIGQRFQHYTWDGEKWVLSSGGIMAPPPPTPGDGYVRAIGALRSSVGGSGVIAEHLAGKNVFI